jgi:hypothetical protein
MRTGTRIGVGSVVLADQRYDIDVSSYRESVVPYFAEPLRTEAPSYRTTTVESVYFQDTWHRGMGDERHTEVGRYRKAVSINGSLKGMAILGPELAACTITNLPANFTPDVRFFAWAGGRGPVALSLWAAGNALYRRVDATTWTYISFPGPPTTTTDYTTQICSGLVSFPYWTGTQWRQSLFLAFNGLNLLRYDIAAGTWHELSNTPAYQLAVAGGRLWRTFPDANLGWALANSADGSTWGGNIQVADGTMRPTWLWTWIGERLMVSCDGGLYPVQQAGIPAESNLAPEWATARSLENGHGASYAAGLAVVPTSGYSWEMFGEQAFLLSPDRAATGTGLGRLRNMAPASAIANVALMDGSVALRALYDDTMQPGRGWHPIAPVSSSNAVIAHQEGAPPYLRLYVGTSTGILTGTLPMSAAVQGIAGVRYVPQGDLYVSGLDFGLPTIHKHWHMIRIQAELPAGSRIEVWTWRHDQDESMAVLKGTVMPDHMAGHMEQAITIDEHAPLLNIRLRLVRGTNVAETPVINSLTVHAYLLPPRLRQISFAIIGDDRAFPLSLQDAQAILDRLRSLMMARHALMVRLPWGAQVMAHITDLQVVGIGSIVGQQPSWGVQVQLQEVVMGEEMTGAALWRAYKGDLWEDLDTRYRNWMEVSQG